MREPRTTLEHSMLDATLSAPHSYASTPSITYITPPTDVDEDPFYPGITFSLVYKDLAYSASLLSNHAFELSQHRAVFLSSLEKPNETFTDTPISVESLIIRFFQFLLDRKVQTSLILPLVVAFRKDFLILNDIHSVIASLPESRETQKALICTYYATISRCGLQPDAHAQQTALLTAAERRKTKLVAIFGGQGASNSRCFRDLRDLYHTYAPFLDVLISTVDTALCDLCIIPATRDFFKGREICLLSWLKNPHMVPEEEFLATAAVSFVIHGVVALANWCITCKVVGKHPGSMRSLLAGTSGHSQGIIVAAAISASDSWPSFYKNATLVTKLLFWTGYECHHAAPRLTLTTAAVNETESRGDGQPSHMLHVSGIPREHVISLIAKCNHSMDLEKRVYLALSNSRSSFTVAGPPSSLLRLSQLVHEVSATRGADQSRIPYDQRKPEVEMQFLPISSPFHTPYLETAAQFIKSRLSDQSIYSTQLEIPVFDTRDGSDMKTLPAEHNLLPSLIDAVTIHHVDWISALNSSTYSHALVFGKSLCDMVASNTDGKGVQIISATELTSSNARFGSKCTIFSPSLPDSFLSPQSWEEQFQARLSRATNGTVQIETKMSKLLRSPPIMIAGMTPTTVAPDFVAAAMNAGYHAELAAGGYFNAETMSAAIEEVSLSVKPGKGVTCNLIYANPQFMAWQIAILRRLARNQRSIDGLTIGAGVPSLDVASEYITTLGLRHISFKPGSVDAIKKVLEIADAHPDFPIIIQWTGGRGGGHHSFEDFHHPILQLYGKIRYRSNVILVAGSGFGDAEGSYPYLTGSWSTAYGYPPMPFDGVLLGSRVMVAKEAHTSQSVKQLICNVRGTDDDQWSKSYTQPTGEIVTVQSEMGQPIHKIATRGVLFWKEMDDKIFSLPRAKQIAAIQARRDYIIKKLNDDFAKPWFCRKHNGENVDLSEMTYLEILSRLVSLTYLPRTGKYIDPSYKNLVQDVVVRILERFNSDCEIKGAVEATQLEHILIQHCPQVSSTIVHPEDVSWFLKRCKRRGQKPVNFIPVLDEDFSTWMKKDSLWQSENIEAVVDEDPGRVCILQGPVAAKFSQQVDEPVADILDGIKNSWISMLSNEFYKSKDIPSEENVWESVVAPSSQPNIKVIEHNHGMTVRAIHGRDLPTENECLQYIARKTQGWMRAVVLSDFILEGRFKRKNFLRSSFHLDKAKKVEINKAKTRMIVQTVVSDKSSRTLMEMYSADGASITAQIFHYNPGNNTPTVLYLKFEYDPQNSLYPLKEDISEHNMQIKSFYSRLWLGKDIEHDSCAGVHSTFGGYRTVLSAENLHGWIASVGLSHANDRHFSPSIEVFPLNATIIPAWEALVQPLMVPEIDGDLLRLVHLSIEFELLPGCSPLRVGQTVDINSSIQSITIDDKGKTVAVRAIISRHNRPAVAIVSKFLIQGAFSNFEDTFQDKTEPNMILTVTSPVEEMVLRTRPWFQLEDEKTSLIGKVLCFKCRSIASWSAPNVFEKLRVTGDVFIQDRRDKLQQIGSVEFEAAGVSGSPIMDFLMRKGKLATERHELEKPGWVGPSSQTVKMPSNNDVYARISKDYNPIHVSPIFSTVANLPGTIVHGMYTSAVTSAVMDHVTNDFNHLRTRHYTVSFVDKVLPGEEVELRYRHVAMVEGRLILQIQAFKASTGDKVLEGEAELEQVPTAYLFTGQGSQAPGMGMELYKSSPVARKIWDDIDEYLVQNYGWSILKMVQENPKRLTIHFSGKRGRAIRDRYLSMTVTSVGPDGNLISAPLLQGITSETRSFTFEDTKGLLYATQFAQPAIAVLEKATFEDMRAKGLIQDGALFAGHSLGEFGALACQVEFLPFQQQIDIAFYRGLTMHNAVKRDSTGSTDFSMVAVNPGRVNKEAFNEPALRRLVDMIVNESKKLLEVVNFNVEGEQYVCAGHNSNLYALAEILNKMSRMPSEHIALWARRRVSPDVNPSQIRGLLSAIIAIDRLVKDSVHAAHAMSKPIVLSRGQATIPLQGIDVPFHSAQLRSGVAAWRKFLLTRIQPENIQPTDLLGRFVPNVMGRPFSLDREYIAEAARVMKNETLQSLLNEGLVC